MILNNLDSLRALAALAVVFFHLAGDFPGHLPWLANYGWVGVDLFFVISGLVIPVSADALAGKFKQWRTEFFVRRVSRIYPLFFISSIFFLFYFQPFWNQENSAIWKQIFTHALFIHSFDQETFHGLNHVTWSLAIEFQFYIFVAIFFKQLKNKNPVFLLAFLILISAVWNHYFRNAFPNDQQRMHFYLSQLPGRLDEFAWGIFIWRLWMSDRLTLAETTKSFLPALGGTLLILSGTFIFYSWLSAIQQSTSWLALLGHSLHGILGDIGIRLLIGFCCAQLVLGATLFGKSKLTAPLEMLGSTSYGIYLWHPIVIIATGGYLAGHGNPLIIILLLTIIISIISWIIFEKPARSYLIKLYNRKTRSISSRFSPASLTMKAQ